MTVVLGIPECFPPGEGEIVLSRLCCLGGENSLFYCEEGENLGCLHVEDAECDALQFSVCIIIVLLPS